MVSYTNVVCLRHHRHTHLVSYFFAALADMVSYTKGCCLNRAADGVLYKPQNRQKRGVLYKGGSRYMRQARELYWFYSHMGRGSRDPRPVGPPMTHRPMNFRKQKY